MLGDRMLEYRPVGPMESGDYAVAYPTPGTIHFMTIAGLCRTLVAAERECCRLNEEQVKGERNGR